MDFGIGLDPIGLISGLSNYGAQKRNQKHQERVFHWQRKVQTQGVQMRAKDLERAGISKNLAAGGAVTPMGHQPPTAADPSEAIAAAQAATQMKAEVGKTIAEQELLKAQKEQVDADTQHKIATTRETALKADAQAVINESLGLLTQSQAELASLSVDYKTWEIVNAQLRAELTAKGIKGAQLDNMLKAITIAVDQYNYHYFASRNLPVDQQLAATQRMIEWLSGMVQKAGGASPEEILNSVQEIEAVPGWKVYSKQAKRRYTRKYGFHSRGGNRGYNPTMRSSRGDMVDPRRN